jgi:hypothetical protein
MLAREIALRYHIGMIDRSLENPDRLSTKLSVEAPSPAAAAAADTDAVVEVDSSGRQAEDDRPGLSVFPVASASQSSSSARGSGSRFRLISNADADPLCRVRARLSTKILYLICSTCAAALTAVAGANAGRPETQLAALRSIANAHYMYLADDLSLYSSVTQCLNFLESDQCRKVGNIFGVNAGQYQRVNTTLTSSTHIASRCITLSGLENGSGVCYFHPVHL